MPHTDQENLFTAEGTQQETIKTQEETEDVNRLLSTVQPLSSHSWDTPISLHKLSFFFFFA